MRLQSTTFPWIRPAIPRPAAAGGRSWRAWLPAALVAAAVTAGWAGWAEPRSAAAGRPAQLPVGQWHAYANGDDVLSLALEGTTLWSGTRAGGLVRWDTGAGTYRQYLRPQDPLAGNTVYDIAVDGAGRKWLATDGGLTMLDDGGTPDAADDVWRTYTTGNTFGGLSSNDVRAVAVLGPQVWVGAYQVQDPATGAWSGGGLAMLDTKDTATDADDTWAPVATFEDTKRSLPDGTTKFGLVSDNILALAVTPKGNMWVATAPHWRLENPANPDAPKVWTKVHGGLSYLDTKGTPDALDDAWAGTPCDDMQYTVTCQVQSLALDRQGYMWAGIGGRGVMYFRADDPVIIDEPGRRFDPSDGLGGNYVYDIAFGPADEPALANTVWLATVCVGVCSDRRGGMSVLNHRATLFNRADDEWDLGRFEPFTADDGLARDRAQALVMGDGLAWIGTGPEMGVGGGVSRLTVATQTFGANLSTICPRPGCPALASNFITAIDFGQPGSRWAGHVWVATGSRAAAARRFGSGVLDLNTQGTQARADDVWQQHTTTSTDVDGQPPWAGLAGDNVLSVAVQGDRVWLGSTTTVWSSTAKAYTDGGLSVFDGERWTTRTVANTRQGNEPGLRNDSVTSLAVGCDEELWVGTGSPWDYSGTGVDVLTPGASVHNLAADSWQAHDYAALASSNTTDIAADCDGGYVWVASQHHVAQGQMGSPGGNWVGGGVARWDAAAQTWTKHDVSNGLQSYGKGSVKGEALAVAAGPDGRAWVGTFGTKDMDTTVLVRQRPYWPAILNMWGDDAWTNEAFARSGWVSDIALDADGRVWASTSRGGLARETVSPEGWRVDRATGGLRVFDGQAWQTLDVAETGLPSNDIAVVAVAPNGDVWIGTDGWGLAQLEVGALPATATPTLGAGSPTPSRTPTATFTPSVEPTSTTGAGTPASATPSRTATRRPTSDRPGTVVYLPFAAQRRLVLPTPTGTRHTPTPRPSYTPAAGTASPTAAVSGTPGTGTPVTGTPATGTPATGTPTPATSTPGTGTPDTGTSTPGTSTPSPSPGGPTATPEPPALGPVFMPFLLRPRPRAR